MAEISSLRRAQLAPDAPRGDASLHVREQYLRRRSQRRRLGDRGMTALWMALAALISWLFVVGFATLGH